MLADPSLLGGLELAQARRELDGETSHTAWYALTGLAGLPRDDDAGDAVAGHLYLIGPGARVPLHPLLVYRQEDELGREQVGFLDKAARKRPDREGVAGAVQRAEYLDYASGQTLTPSTRAPRSRPCWRGSRAVGYDDRGNENARTYLGKDGAPALTSDGSAIWHGKSDERGRLLEEAHFGPDGAPVLRARGYSVRKISYDAHGNVFERAHFDGAGRPVLRDDGYSVERSSYDERDNEIERQYLGVAGEPVLREGGYAAFRARYDEVGKLVEKVYLDLRGRPVAAPPPDAAAP